MDKITSIQGKEFEYSDVLLLKKDGNRIIVMLNDEEQLKKFSSKEGDAPVSVVPYTEETYSRLVSQMKQIKSYPENEFGVLNVEYEDGTKTKFSNSNKQIIENTYLDQQRAKAIANDWTKGLENNDVMQKQPINLTGINLNNPNFGNANNSSGLEGQSLEHTNVEKNGRRFKVIKAENINKLKEGNAQIAMYAIICALNGLVMLINIVSIGNPLLIGLNSTAEAFWVAALGIEIGKKTTLENIEKKFEEVELQIKNENNKSRGGK